jgi:uncharacterized membrane protein
MKSKLKLLFWLNLISALLFVLIFAMPILSFKVAVPITEALGCSAGSFDMPSKCPEHIKGIKLEVAKRFGTLSYWPSAFLAPLFFVYAFWDVMLVWSIVIMGLFIAAFWKNPKPADVRTMAQRMKDGE